MKSFLILLAGSALATIVGILAGIPSGWGSAAVSAAFLVGVFAGNLALENVP